MSQDRARSGGVDRAGLAATVHPALRGDCQPSTRSQTYHPAATSPTPVSAPAACITQIGSASGPDCHEQGRTRARDADQQGDVEREYLSERRGEAGSFTETARGCPRPRAGRLPNRIPQSLPCLEGRRFRSRNGDRLPWFPARRNPLLTITHGPGTGVPASSSAIAASSSDPADETRSSSSRRAARRSSASLICSRSRTRSVALAWSRTARTHSPRESRPSVPDRWRLATRSSRYITSVATSVMSRKYAQKGVRVCRRSIRPSRPRRRAKQRHCGLR